MRKKGLHPNGSYDILSFPGYEARCSGSREVQVGGEHYVSFAWQQGSILEQRPNLIRR
jgi:hypothetical protein